MEPAPIKSRATCGRRQVQNRLFSDAADSSKAMVSRRAPADNRRGLMSTAVFC